MAPIRRWQCWSEVKKNIGDTIGSMGSFSVSVLDILLYRDSSLQYGELSQSKVIICLAHAGVSVCFPDNFSIAKFVCCFLDYILIVKNDQ